MKNKTHKIYHGGGEQDWMNIIPVVTSATSKSGEYGGERDKILQNIEQSPNVTEALHQFSELSYNLLVSVYTYWKTLKDKSNLIKINLTNPLDLDRLENFIGKKFKTTAFPHLNKTI